MILLYLLQSTSPADLDIKLRLSLYELLFESYSSQALWSEGLKAVDHAQAHLPREISAVLWSHRAVFKAKLGSDITRDMLKLKVRDSD